MRASLLLLLAAAAIACILAIPSADAAEVYEEDGFTYSIDDGEATLLFADIDVVGTDAVVRDTVKDGVRVTGIGDAVFISDEWTSVTLGRYVDSVEASSFMGQSITHFALAPGYAGDFEVVDGVLMKKLLGGNAYSLVRYPAARSDSTYGIPSDVIQLEVLSFYGCKNLVTLNFPADCLISLIPVSAFSLCTKLAHINHDGTWNNLPESVVIVAEAAFMDCRSLGDIRMPEHLREIGAVAFSTCGFKRVMLDDDLSSVANMAFDSCPNLESFITNQSSFDSYLNYVSVDGVLYHRDSMRTLVAYPSGKVSDVFRIPDEVSHIADGAFYGAKGLGSVVLGNGIIEVPNMAFGQCTALTKVTMTGKVSIIASAAFMGCTSLRTVEGWDSVTSIGLNAFERCAFTELKLPSAIRLLRAYAFSDNGALTEVTVPDSPVTLESDVFRGCAKLSDITFEGPDLTLSGMSLNVGSTDSGKASVTVHLVKDAPTPGSDTYDPQYTDLTIDQEGHRPFPVENLFGVAACLLVLFVIIRLVREV